MAYRIVIDHLRCENNGRCFEKSIGLIQPADDGGPMVAQASFGGEHEGAARNAVRACPMGALRIETIDDS